jgi:hypothetical protein
MGYGHRLLRVILWSRCDGEEEFGQGRVSLWEKRTRYAVKVLNMNRVLEKKEKKEEEKDLNKRSQGVSVDGEVSCCTGMNVGVSFYFDCAAYQ